MLVSEELKCIVETVTAAGWCEPPLSIHSSSLSEAVWQTVTSASIGSDVTSFPSSAGWCQWPSNAKESDDEVTLPM